MAHTVSMVLPKTKLEAAGMEIHEEHDCFVLTFRQDENKSQALGDAGARLTDAGFRTSAVDEFLDELVSFDNALHLLKLR